MQKKNIMEEIWTSLVFEIRTLVKWFSDPQSWKIIGILTLTLIAFAIIVHFSIKLFHYQHRLDYCPRTQNAIIITEFFSFAFFGVFAAAALGEIINRVDKKKKGIRETEKATYVIGFSILSAIAGVVCISAMFYC